MILIVCCSVFNLVMTAFVLLIILIKDIELKKNLSIFILTCILCLLNSLILIVLTNTDIEHTERIKVNTVNTDNTVNTVNTIN